MNKLYKSPNQWTKCGSPDSVRRQLREWYNQLPGQWLQQDEIRVLKQVLPNLFGYNMLQVGLNYDGDCMASSRIPYQMILDVDMHKSQPIPPYQANCKSKLIGGAPEFLPFAADSLDVLILSHVLGFTSDPHEILREADRTLIPEGHVIIMGFNPWGLWMLWRIFLSWTKKPPWCGKFVRQARLRDWLQLLGFDIIETHGYFFRPPLSHTGIMHKLRFLEHLGQRWWPFLSGGFVIVAKKRVSSLTPLKPRWRPRRSRIVSPGLAGNSTATNKDNAKKYR